MPLLEKATRPTEGMPGARAHSDGAPVVPKQSRAERTTSFDLADFPVPTGREEDWRFTPVDRLGPLLRDTPSGAHLAWRRRAAARA